MLFVFILLFHVWLQFNMTPNSDTMRSRARSEPGGTRWRTGGEVKGKLMNGVGSQYSHATFRTWFIQHYSSWCAHLGCQQSTELTSPTDLNGLARFRERRNLVSARVPSRSARAITTYFHLVNDTGLVWGMKPFLLHGTAYLFALHQYQNIQS